MKDKIKLRDNRFGNSALAFEQMSEGNGFVSVDPCDEGLGGQKITKEGRKVLRAFGGLSLDELVDRSNGSLVNLFGTHLDSSGREKLHFFRELKG